MGKGKGALSHEIGDQRGKGGCLLGGFQSYHENGMLGLQGEKQRNDHHLDCVRYPPALHRLDVKEVVSLHTILLEGTIEHDGDGGDGVLFSLEDDDDSLKVRNDG
ncbi:hypothetical protein Tco_0665940 [Tanacetum coccineum]